MRGQDHVQLTLSLEGSPVSHSPLPGSGEAREMTATSGRRWSGLSKNSGPLGSLERMLLGSSGWHSPIYYLSWKPKDIGQGHFLYQLALSEPDTGGTGLRSWPTPKATDYKGSGPAGSRSAQHDLERGNLKGAVMFATPQARDYRSGQESRWRDPERSRNLNDQIAMYPTPTVGAGLCGGTGSFRKLKKLREDGTITETERKSMSQGNGGQLNPDWVEWLMGFPVGWTDIGI